jgi:hypothetical protein
MLPALFYKSTLGSFLTDALTGVIMFIKQSELLMGTSMDFIKKFMDIS